jgi:O-antigen/teichoic acid export membrane protein
MQPAADPSLRPVTAGAAMSATSRGLVAVTGAVTTILVARLLGPAGAGAFAIAITLVVMLLTFATLGLEHGMAYHVSSGRWAPRGALVTVTRVALVTGTTAALVGLAVRLAVPSAFAGLSTASVALVVAAMPFVLLWHYRSYLALAVDRYEGFVVPPAVQSSVAMVLVLGCALAFGLTGALVALTLSHVAGALATLRTVRRLPDAGGDGEPRQLARAVRFGLKGYAGNGAAAVGQLSVALAVVGVLWLLPHALSEVVFPRVATLSARADGQAERAMVEAKGVRHAVLMISGGTAVIAAALLLLVVPVFGEAFRPAIELGLILLPGVALLGIGQVLSAIIVGRGRPQYLLYAALIVTPLTVAGYVLLVPALGATGAALVKTLSFTLSFALSVVFHRRATGASLGVFVPTRDELDDLVRLPAQIRRWASGALRSR